MGDLPASPHLWLHPFSPLPVTRCHFLPRPTPRAPICRTGSSGPETYYTCWCRADTVTQGLSSSISWQFCNILQRNLQHPGLVQMSLTKHLFLWLRTQSLKPPPVANYTSLRNIQVSEELETHMYTYTSPTTTNQQPSSHTSTKVTAASSHCYLLD